jgi:hypothetical protein
MSVSFSKCTEPTTKLPDGVPKDKTALGPELSALLAEAKPIVLTGERLLAAEAMWLLMRLDRDIREARAQWNQDWFRRLMHARSKAVCRLRRRWLALNPQPTLSLGSLRRRYHANLARYLCELKYG